jgi:hypothetical protein
MSAEHLRRLRDLRQCVAERNRCALPSSEEKAMRPDSTPTSKQWPDDYSSSVTKYVASISIAVVALGTLVNSVGRIAEFLDRGA